VLNQANRCAGGSREGERGEDGEHLMYPLKRLQKLGYKNAIKYKNIRTLDFFTSPYTP
jgi:hypothetical protein